MNSLIINLFSLKFVYQYAFERNPQYFIPGRLCGFYLLTRNLIQALLSNKYDNFWERKMIELLRNIALLGQINSILIMSARFSPNILFLPENSFKKDPRSGQMNPIAYLFWFPWTFLEVLTFKKLVLPPIFESSKPLIERFDLIHSIEKLEEGEDDRRQCIYQGMWPGFFEKSRFPPNIDLILDLSNELNAHILKGQEYINIPVWDQTCPNDKELFLRAVNYCALFKGNIYIHCAFGVGRSSLATVCILIKRGICSSVDEAVSLVKSRRKYVEMRPSQILFLNEMLPRLLL